EGRLVDIEEGIALWGGCRSVRGRPFGTRGWLWRDDSRGCGCGTAGDGAFQEVAPAESRIGHERLRRPGFGTGVVQLRAAFFELCRQARFGRHCNAQVDTSCG